MFPTRTRSDPSRLRFGSPRTPRRATAALGAATALAVTALTAAGPVPVPAIAAEPPTAALTIRLDPSYQHPSFEGWGTALAWFARVTGGWPDAQRKRLADDLYGADGLGFTVARYNIGGGDSPETTPYMRPGADVPGYWAKPGPESPDWWDPDRADHWNASADANQQWWLSAAKARGATTFEAFSNSAPYFMTNSQLASGAANGWEDNLRSDQYDRFAGYLTGSLQRAQSATGVTFDSISPVNEPDTDYWHAGWPPGGFALGPGLPGAHDHHPARRDGRQGRHDSDRFHGRDEPGEVPVGLGGIRSRRPIHGGPAQHAHVRDERPHRGAGHRQGEATPLWMSEVDVGGSVPQSFTSMSPALDLAQRINDDVRELEPRAWVLWQAVEDYENMTAKPTRTPTGD